VWYGAIELDAAMEEKALEAISGQVAMVRINATHAQILRDEVL
jgi:hypothetical protein